MGYHTILFDLDGTLTDPGLGITNSVMYALDRFGIHESDRTKLYPFIGPPLWDSFMRFYGMSRDQAEEAVRVYREYYGDRGLLENSVYPSDAGSFESSGQGPGRGHLQARGLLPANFGPF